MAFAAASKLPESEQDAMAALVLEELESEARWAKAFSEHPEALKRLADEALAEHRAGRTKPLDDAD